VLLYHATRSRIASDHRVDAISKTFATSSLTDASLNMVKTITSTQATDKQTQFGNARHLDPSDCIFVFKDTLSDYEEPLSDEEVSALSQSHCDRFLYRICSSRPISCNRNNERCQFQHIYTSREYSGYIVHPL